MPYGGGYFAKRCKKNYSGSFCCREPYLGRGRFSRPPSIAYQTPFIVALFFDDLLCLFGIESAFQQLGNALKCIELLGNPRKRSAPMHGV